MLETPILTRKSRTGEMEVIYFNYVNNYKLNKNKKQLIFKYCSHFYYNFYRLFHKLDGNQLPPFLSKTFF